MIEIFLIVAIIMGVFKLITEISGIFQRKNVSQNSSYSWYGICDNCGKKDGLHRMNKKRYCAMCYATIKVKGTADKQEYDER